jgi:TetR/AcrR family transcriptional regulator
MTTVLRARSAYATDLPRRRSSGEETRAAILEAAERRFAERGFEAARLEDIAADVGIRRAAIFYHFRDKHELYAAVLSAVFGDALRVLPATGTPGERLLAATSGWIDYVAQRPTVARLILREAASAQPGVASPMQRAGATLVQWLHLLIDAGVASGELEPLVDPRRFMSLMGTTTVFHFAAMPSLTPGTPFDPAKPAEIARHKREMLQVARRMLGIEASGGTR